MIDPNRLDRLWKACEDLRPRIDGMCAGVADPHWLHVRLFDGEFSFWFANKQGNMGDVRWVVHPSLAHAIARDRIVWWLATKQFQDHVAADRYLILSIHDGQTEIEWCDQRFKWLIDSNADKTVACIEAAERVLGLEEWKE